MALKLYPESDVQAIATAIRGKNGLSTTYKIGDMRAAITALPSGGGATNFVQGTFTVPLNQTGTVNVSLNYTGSGYPIAAIVVVDGGMYNESTQNTTLWYNAVHRYAIGEWTMTKTDMSLTPTYSGTSADVNYGVILARYKSSSTTATTYSNGSSSASAVYGGTASTTSTTCIKITSATQLQYTISDTSYGLLEGITYRYMVIYSS